MAGVILRISAPHEGYRRAGRAWSCGSPQEVEASSFTSEQLASLRADSRLTIVEVRSEEQDPSSLTPHSAAVGASLPPADIIDRDVDTAAGGRDTHTAPLTPHVIKKRGK